MWYLIILVLVLGYFWAKNNGLLGKIQSDIQKNNKNSGVFFNKIPDQYESIEGLKSNINKFHL